jgi:adenylate cyclase
MSTKSASGFSAGDISIVEHVLPALATVVEVRSTLGAVQTLMDTYVGAGVRARVLGGQVHRGAFETIEAVVWYADLRNFTAMSEHASSEELIGLLNGWADQMVPPVERHGGEVIKFMGDGMLALFPVGPYGADAAAARGNACREALAAGKEAIDNMQRWNDERAGRKPVRFGLALHVGRVIYGNVGAAHRLDFTAVGQTVNIAARLEKLSKDLGQPLLMSEEFCSMSGCRTRSLGRFELRGVAQPMQVFAPEEAKPTEDSDLGPAALAG